MSPKMVISNRAGLATVSDSQSFGVSGTTTRRLKSSELGSIQSTVPSSTQQESWLTTSIKVSNLLFPLYYNGLFPSTFQRRCVFCSCASHAGTVGYLKRMERSGVSIVPTEIVKQGSSIDVTKEMVFVMLPNCSSLTTLYSSGSRQIRLDHCCSQAGHLSRVKPLQTVSFHLTARQRWG
eukprot:TRINITY_DN12125_c0_g2_i14.p1 TRINITY_DN12125_c0_g2~~TRINITY_DN12125_c0_g2_i14.p1  ORF type:complete len:179 (+),score=2.78 TRINITY_DN12125_c0_g2_i14:248-784(+)